MLALRDVAGKSAKAGGFVELILDWRDDEIQPAILAGRRASHKLVPEFGCSLRPLKIAREPVAFRNNAEDCEKRVADDLFGVTSEKSLSGEVHARQLARDILGKDHVARLLDEIPVTRFKLRALEQARDFCH